MICVSKIVLQSYFKLVKIFRDVVAGTLIRSMVYFYTFSSMSGFCPPAPLQNQTSKHNL